MTTANELKPGMLIRVQEPRPVAEGIVTWIEGDVVNVAGSDGASTLFARGDMASVDEYLVEILEQPGPVPLEPLLGTHWLGSDNVVYTHYHSGWNEKPWVGNGQWDLSWEEVYWRARPLLQMVEMKDVGAIE